MQASYLTEAKSTTYKQKRPREGSLWSAGQSRVNWRNWGPFWGLPTQSAHYLLERKELRSNLLHAAQRWKAMQRKTAALADRKPLGDGQTALRGTGIELHPPGSGAKDLQTTSDFGKSGV
jgi:hypothetical protein